MKANQFKALMLLVLTAIIPLGKANAQFIMVSGKVTEAESGTPLAGCSVQIVGTMEGTLTDLRGCYSIQVEKGRSLSFSYIGYQTVKRKVVAKRLDVALLPDTQVLEEYIVLDVAATQCKEMPNVMAHKQRSFAICPAPICEVNAEEYGGIEENGFREVPDAPLSTFSIDVDAASYSNVRRFINKGELPPADAVRTEELVNYFSYDYPKPTGNDPVKITIEAGACPWNAATRLVRVGLKAKEIPTDNLAASNLVFLIDVSGSMYGAHRLGLVKSSLKLLVNNLREKDKVAIVTYAGTAGVKLQSTPGSDKQKIREAIDELTAGGSTAGGAGIRLAYQIAKKNFITGGNNRIILCSDGDFNVGISSAEGLERLIDQERKSGVFLTVLGYGMGNYKDKKMQVLAEKGNGNHAYIDNLQEANRVLVGEFGATLHTVAKDMKLQVEFNPAQVEAYRLIGYESRLLKDEDFNNDAKDAGELGAGHTVTAFYEVVPVGMKDAYPGKIDNLKYQKKGRTKAEPTGSKELLTVKLRYKDPDKDTSRKMEFPFVDNKRDDVSADFRFASAVAMFGQLLRDSDYKGNANYEKVIALAKQGLDKDEQGYRREFVRLVEAAKGIEQGK